MSQSFRFKAFTEPIYATDGMEWIRTEPTPNTDVPFIGYVKTTKGEAQVVYSSKVLTEVLCSGKEITKEEYESAVA